MMSENEIEWISLGGWCGTKFALKQLDLVTKSLPFDNVDKTKISYPFAMMKSVNNDNCLTNNHGTITVQPCYSFVAQRWMPMEN